MFEREERHLLHPLPKDRFEIKTYLNLTPGSNYHVYFKRFHQYYSVPHRFCHQPCKVILTATHVSITGIDNHIFRNIQPCNDCTLRLKKPAEGPGATTVIQDRFSFDIAQLTQYHRISHLEGNSLLFILIIIIRNCVVVVHGLNFIPLFSLTVHRVIDQERI